jgi:hypothetical protein
LLAQMPIGRRHRARGGIDPVHAYHPPYEPIRWRRFPPAAATAPDAAARSVVELVRPLRLVQTGGRSCTRQSGASASSCCALGALLLVVLGE